MRKTIIAVAAAGLLSLAACGDDDSPAADEASADDASADDTAGAASGDFCGQLEAVQDRFDDVELEGDDLGDNSEFEAAVAELQGIDPPSEIADDWNTITDAMSGFADIPADLSDDEMLEEFMSRFGAFDPEEMERASENIENYVRDECGFELG